MEEMHLAIEIQRDVLVATISGQFVFEIASSMLKDLVDESASRGVHKVLVDALSVGGVPTAVDRYEMGAGTADHLHRRGLRSPLMAIVGTPPVCDGFGVLVANIRGLISKMFPEVDSALGWLNSEPTTRTG